jgi:hypothetical protein
MSDERAANEPDDETTDLELTDEDAENVRGGDAAPVSNIMKTKHDTVKNTISNIH